MWAMKDGSLAFVHIPKTGGISITEQLNLDHRTMRKDEIALLNPNTSKHDTGVVIRNMMSTIHAEPVLFAVVRDPFARAHSMWLQFTVPSQMATQAGTSTTPKHDRYVATYYGDPLMGFKRFLHERPAWQWHPKLGEDPSLVAWNGWWPQWHWVSDHDTVVVDHIFNIKRLKKLGNLLKQRGLIYTPKIKLNVKSDKNWHVMYDEECRELVRNYFAVDFDRLGFTRDLL